MAKLKTPGTNFAIVRIKGCMLRDKHTGRKKTVKSRSVRANSHQATANLILEAIPRSEYERILPSLEPVTLEWHHVLHQASEPIKFGIFPNGGVVSFIVTVSDGRSAEVGMVGREGFVGAPLVGGLDRSPHTALVQVGATAMRIGAGALLSVLPSTPQLATLLTRHALVQGMQLAQTAACNRLHNLPQRLARWLLMSHDRINSSVLPYTQDLLAIMLGTDRPSVCIALGELQGNGSVRQKRARVEVIDRFRLESSACECYGVIREFDREFGAK